MESDGQEEETSHAGVFIDETNISNSMIVVREHGENGVELRAGCEIVDALRRGIGYESIRSI